MPTRKTTPYYNSATDQSVFTQTGQLHVLGDEMWLDNRKFRYCRAVANLTAGYAATHRDGNVQILGETSSHIQATSDGDTTVNLKNLPGITVNEFAEGEFAVTEGTGEGYLYNITSNAATGGTSNSLTLTLSSDTPIRVGTVGGTSAGQLYDSKYVVQNMTASSTAPETAVCVPLVDVTSGNYFWGQVKGDCVMLAATRVITKGMPVTLAVNSTGRVMAPSTAHVMVVQASIGTGLIAARAATEWGVVNLNLE